MNSNINALKTLGINPSELDQLSKEERASFIRKKWLKLLIPYHPDRNNDNPEAKARFAEIMEAFNFLSESKSESNASGYIPEINRYFFSQPVEIPQTAFDCYLREGIERSYERLIEEFSTLTTEEDKRKFAEYYAPFFNIYNSLPPFDGNQHGHYFMERVNETLLESIRREWRELVIRTYGKELLSDFKYRHAMATGHLYPILAMYKLLSPLKALSLLANSALILISCVAQHVLKTILIDCIPEITRIIMSAITTDKLYYKQLALPALKLMGIIIGVVSLICVMSCLSPLAMSIILGFSVISELLEHLASPINMIARPLATRFGISPKWFIAFAVIATPLLVCGLVYLGSVISLLAIIPYITIALYVANCVADVMICYELYKKNPTAGGIVACIMGLCLIHSFITKQPLSSEHISTMSSFFINLIGCLVSYSAVHSLKTINHNYNHADEISASLPLPAEKISEEIEEATLLGYSNATTQSHRFFNTPKDAQCLSKDAPKVDWKKGNNVFFPSMVNQSECNIPPNNSANYFPSELLMIA